MSSAEPDTLIGWDVGGAHVKACLVQGGAVHDIAQWRCPLWQGLDQLDLVLQLAAARWAHPGPAGGAGALLRRVRHAVTMTGEVVDCFADRAQGVRQLAARLSETLGPRLMLYGGAEGWIAPGAATTRWRAIASANWHASAHWLAARIDSNGDSNGDSKGESNGDALLVDIGSTTTDLIAVSAGHVRAQGHTDAARLACGELVYLGVVRTPLCALAPQVAFADDTVNVMNEFFATTADVYRLTGELDPAHDQHPAADGGGKDLAGSRQRLARMIGRDAADADEGDWLALAQVWRSAQIRTIGSQLLRVAERGAVAADAPLVAAGCGDFLVAGLADALGRPWRSFSEQVPITRGVATTEATSLRRWAQVCAPAVAVALLAGSA